ncbi:LacI family DNA-binding transcriptional regulator [Corynebacterium belfantii]|uniref:LacI family DNA-binding transcriptional regulator n=1 Tax=Corynebacterium belfantii TaxID=2014537 RepID=A0ABS0LBS8_9CORY|nr:LacI family DNA-binding transcriptional regulator [Corynebacterium belfantii]OLN15991.1 LacI family transcriptional regulator [Corynebacterium diphtheriae subsp. lausannense]QVI98925.1 LacI family DNA-binding transcriptional regulator [Corynebacterium diphtheriae]MBG9309827.1 LacI family DNA-binding transcriptional regulator [Corynebacterium belfantii]MBG9347137.1 LacI family DNA-binding transcriptional regulator [Corynebacterium belfantii]MBG9354000.1 LacI family DNA-binding transcriptiona
MASRNTQRPSLAALAAELGVSRTTVSNAYNHPQQLSAELREQILATAERLGYLGPDPTARSLRTRRVGSVGVLFTDHLTYAFEDLASVDFLAGMAEASAGSQTSMTLVPVGPDSLDPTAAKQLVNSAVVDGFVVYSVAKGDPFLEAVHARGLPAVVCDQPADDHRMSFVGIDDHAAIAPAAQALVDAGHRNIGILCIRLDSEPNNGPVSLERLERAHHHVQRARVQGAIEVFDAAGIPAGAVPIIERHINDPANNIDAARELLTAHPDVTAILCTTDTMAFGVLEYAKELGLRVPEDLSVTGFDGIAPALNRELTTVLQPNKIKGELAGTLLYSMIEEAQKNPNVISRGQLHCEILATSFHPGATVVPPNEHRRG